LIEELGPHGWTNRDAVSGDGLMMLDGGCLFGWESGREANMLSRVAGACCSNYPMFLRLSI